jgi:hypothetical protein
VNKLDILKPFCLFALTGSQMTIKKSDPGMIDGHEQDNASFMSGVALKASLNIKPLEPLHPLANLLQRKDKGGNANQIMIGY